MLNVSIEMTFFDSKKFPVFLIVGCFLGIGYLVISYPISYGGGDNYVHYVIARYAWQYPYLFLDHWGKPMYSILSSPLAQLGYPWAKLFNVMVGMGAAFFTYQSARLLKLENAWLSILLVCFSPVYFMMFNTTMTELLCSFLIIISFWFFLKKNYVVSTIIISFLPLARPEGPLWLVVFAYALLINQQYRYLPLLVTGSLLFSSVGALYYYHDFFWIINQSPYSSAAAAIYGKGPLLHFISNYKYLTGYSITFFMLTGVLFIIFEATKKKNISTFFKRNDLIFLLLPSILFVVVHSLLWYFGTGYSVGELRVIAIIIPLLSLIALIGYNFIFKYILTSKLMKFMFLTILCIIIVKENKNAYANGYALSWTDQVSKNAADWIISSGYSKNKIYYFSPLFYILLDLNPFDSGKITSGVPDVYHPEIGIKPGALVIWDAHLGPNEGKVPLKNLLENPHFKLLKLFTPAIPFTVLGGYTYEIYVFQRNPDDVLTINNNVLKFFDYEKHNEQFDIKCQTSEQSFSGSYSYKLDHSQLYSTTFAPTIGELRKADVYKITASACLFPVFDAKENGTALIMSFERDTSYNYNSIGLESIPYQLNAWNYISLSCTIPLDAKDNDVLKIFFFQPGEKYIYLDDFKIEVIKIKNQP